MPRLNYATTLMNAGKRDQAMQQYRAFKSLLANMDEESRSVLDEEAEETARNLEAHFRAGR